MLCMIFAFALSFFLIATNQLAEYQKKYNKKPDPSAENYPTYDTVLGAMSHVLLLILGDFLGADNSLYDYGDPKSATSYFAWGLFYVICMMMVVHMMNMLIALMGEV